GQGAQPDDVALHGFLVEVIEHVLQTAGHATVVLGRHPDVGVDVGDAALPGHHLGRVPRHVAVIHGQADRSGIGEVDLHTAVLLAHGHDLLGHDECGRTLAAHRR